MRLCYVHLPRFPVQRKVLDCPNLANRPFVLHGDDRGQQRVFFASTSAMTAGIRAGMTVTAANALLPTIGQFPWDAQRERSALSSLAESLLSASPQFELDAPEGLWLNAETAKLFGGEAGFCNRILEACSALGYRAKIAIASERFTAKVLAHFGARRADVVPQGESAAALRPLPLKALEASERGVTGLFHSLGLSTLGEVAAFPVGALSARLGAVGMRVHALCRGEDSTLFVPEPLSESFIEAVDLEWPAESLEPVLFAAKTAVDRLCTRLSARGRALIKLAVTFRLDPSGEQRVNLTLSRPGSSSKLIVDLLRQQLSDLSVPSPIASVSVFADETCPDGARQLTLGDAPEGDASLDKVLARLTTTLGEEALFSAELQNFHRPEMAYAKTPFRPPVRERGLFAELLPKDGALGRQTADVDPISMERPMRFFRQAALLEAETGASGEILSARILGKRRRATAFAGPERLGGDWWSSQYQRDYFRVCFEDFGAVWVYRDEHDGRYYLQGMFD